MSRAGLVGLFINLIFLTSGCSVNILENFADKSSNEALYYDAQKLINEGDYTGALAKIALMTGSYTSERKVVNLKASAYGGICGINFLDFVTSMTNIGTTRLFPFLVAHFRSPTGTKFDACIEAETLIDSLGVTSTRTDDENLFMAVIGLAKVGTFLGYYTDSDGNGVGNTGVNPCLHARVSRPTSAVAGDFYDADLREFGTGLTKAIANLSAVGASISFGQDSLTDLTAICTTLQASFPTYNFCSITDPADFTASQLKGLMSLIKESSSVGLGTNCTGDLSACNCP